MNWVCLGVSVRLRCQLIVRGTPGCDNTRDTSRHESGVSGCDSSSEMPAEVQGAPGCDST